MWPFRKKPKAAGQMWAVGDIAECIEQEGNWANPGGFPPCCPAPSTGVQSMVKGVKIERKEVYLRLVGFEGAWDAESFRKIIPTMEEPKVSLRAPLPKQPVNA